MTGPFSWISTGPVPTVELGPLANFCKFAAALLFIRYNEVCHHHEWQNRTCHDWRCSGQLIEYMN